MDAIGARRISGPAGPGGTMRDDGGHTALGASGLGACIDHDPNLTESQRRRLRVFLGVEDGVVSRVESLCLQHDIEVTDLGVLVISADAREVFFGPGGEDSTNVILGHRRQIHGFLHAVLPPGPNAAADPYLDLLEPAPAFCVRVLIVDAESVTVLSYGSFVTVMLNGREVPTA
jgi:hypothetical protein